MDINSVNVTGRLTADPQLRYTNDHTAAASFRLAIGGRNDRTDFVGVTAWGKPAEAVAEHKSKGDQIAVTGRITSSDWTDDRGQRHYRTGITAELVVFLARVKQPAAS
ncbi:MAG: single-stranded DNA-binding protein [Acidimicrobiia bacterium]|nr:single-stranded DNA-binding protein [Acidimicrobiia bacterium]